VSLQEKIQSPCSVAGRSGGGGGGVVDENAGRRRASAPAQKWCGGAPSLSLGPAAKRKGQESGGGRRYCGGGKRSKLPPAPVFIPKRAALWRSWVVFHYPDRCCGTSPRRGAEWCGGYYNRATRP
jgi:hypothetical protein